MATRNDPSETTTLRLQFMKDMRKRFGSVSTEISKLVVGKDVFGLEKRQPFQPLLNTIAYTGPDVPDEAWRFRTDEDKLQAFQGWLAEMVKKKILTVDQAKSPWTSKYVQSAYKKGVIRAYVDARGKSLRKSADFFAGTKAQFLRSSFAQPEKLSKIRLLATRAFTDLQGVTAVMASQMNRILANGLTKGLNPRQIATELAKNVDGLTKQRALVIARTEIIHAHAEGQLDSLEEQGVDSVSAMVEWSTAGDGKVCPECEEMEGKTFTIQEARGQIPLHPNCRCAWLPVSEVQIQAKAKRRSKKAQADADRQNAEDLQRAESNEALIARLFAEGSTTDTMRAALGQRYPGKDPAYVSKRLDTYLKIAQRAARKAVVPPVVVTPPPAVAPRPAPPPTPPPPPVPRGRESNEALVARLHGAGTAPVEIKAALALKYPGKDDAFVQKRYETYLKIAQRNARRATAGPRVQPTAEVAAPSQPVTVPATPYGPKRWRDVTTAKEASKTLSEFLSTGANGERFTGVHRPSSGIDGPRGYLPVKVNVKGYLRRERELVDAVNLIGRQHERLLQTYPQFGKRLRQGLENSNYFLSGKAPFQNLELVHAPLVDGRGSRGTYNSITQQIRIATNRGANEISARTPLELGRHWVVDNTWTGTVRHEMGHAIHYGLPTAKWDEWQALVESRRAPGDSAFRLDQLVEDQRTPNAWKRELSTYSATNLKETFAEAFSAYTHPIPSTNGVDLPSDVKAFFDSIMK